METLKVVLEISLSDADEDVKITPDAVRSIFMDALSEFRSARGADVFGSCNETEGIAAYVAKRYQHQTLDAHLAKVEEVSRRCVLAQILRHGAVTIADPCSLGGDPLCRHEDCIATRKLVGL